MQSPTSPIWGLEDNREEAQSRRMTWDHQLPNYENSELKSKKADARTGLEGLKCNQQADKAMPRTREQDVISGSYESQPIGSFFIKE